MIIIYYFVFNILDGVYFSGDMGFRKNEKINERF